MKNKLTKYVLGILAITFVMTSCSKNEDALATVQSNKQEILTFKTVEDFNTTLSKVVAMSDSERKSWEKEQGFKSFGTTCDEFYETIVPEKFKNRTEIENFISLNKDKIQFYDNSNGDIYCVTQYFKSSERYIMNQDKMYIVGNKAYKYFDEEMVSTNISNIDVLRKAKSSAEINSNILFMSKRFIQKAPIQKATQYEGHYYDKWDDNKWGTNTYRIHVFFDVFNYFELTEFDAPKHRLAYYKVMNFSLSLGIWWGKTLTTTINVNAETYDDWSGIWLNYNGGKTNEAVRSHQENFGRPLTIDDTQPYFYSLGYTASNEKGCSVTD